MRCKPWNRESDESDESVAGAKLGGEQAEAIASEVAGDTTGELIALFPGENAREEFHHLWVGVEARKRFEVGLEPVPEEQTVGGDGHKMATDWTREFVKA